jgi:hypothetical protein
MKTETRKVYQCEHCKKRMLSAGSMARHERFCRMKPENRHKCFDLCRHLKKNRILIDNGRDPFDRNSYKTEFTCDETGYKLYSYLLEKKASLFCNQGIKFDGMRRMPTSCIHYEYMNESEYAERFEPKED